MKESEWKVISPHCIEHKKNGSMVSKLGNRYEVLYRVNGQYKHGGMHNDAEVAKREAAKGLGQ
ncbi:hypothetical protein [Pseudohongiella sp. O18]|uniref:hypothetical protein n=1 Tax=Pseudohongiella sp. O18 TaxID=2904248 RepID=UPI001F3080D4|nr:hypothetical protein [Pseudohongiella sp. O18]